VTDDIRQIIERLRSAHADKVFVAKDYTKADLIRDLENYRRSARGPQSR
jgi:hypothetical protein